MFVSMGEIYHINIYADSNERVRIWNFLRLTFTQNEKNSTGDDEKPSIVCYSLT